jgi:predicted peroxiredoxin
MTRMLFHITTGTEDPTRAALGLLVARTATAAGHQVEVFFAGDGVDWLRAETRAAANGIGTGSIAEHFDALVSSDAGLFGSGMSAKARGVSADETVALSPPDKLVELIDGADKVIVY